MTAPASRTAPVNGFNLHYWEWAGSGPAIVCLHPSGHYGRIWEWVAERLSPDLRVIAPDQRGHGDSTEPPDGGASAEHYAADLLGLADALGLGRFIVAGHSLGARAGMVFAGQHPDRASGLVLVGGPHYSTLHPGADVDYWKNNAARMRARPRRNDSASAAADVLRASYAHFTTEAIDHCVRHNTNALPGGAVEWKYNPTWVADGLAHALDDLRPYAAKVACPTLILRAEKSWELTPERMAEIEGLLPTARTITVPGTQQNLELEAPDQVAGEIREFALTLPSLASQERVHA